jgi:2-oxoglutarate dehydrogenase E1 component
MLLKVDTAYTKEGLTQVANAVCNLPEDKKFISKIQKLINDRKQCFLKQIRIGMSILLMDHCSEGYNVRISGQDVERGTFSHRHAVVK